MSEGQKVLVKCTGIDEKSGKIKLSRKALIPKPEGADAEPEGEAGATMIGPGVLGLPGDRKHLPHELREEARFGPLLVLGLTDDRPLDEICVVRILYGRESPCKRT